VTDLGILEETMGQWRARVGPGLLAVWVALVILVPLWSRARWAVALLAIIGVSVAFVVVRDRQRRRVQGYWVEYVPPGVVRGAQDEFAIVYHEGGKRLTFEGTERRRPDRDVLCFMSATAWDGQVPAWARGRRDIIKHRVLSDARVQGYDVREEAYGG
jgi:hypothetical protein